MSWCLRMTRTWQPLLTRPPTVGPQGQPDSDSDFLSPPRGGAGPSIVQKNRMILYNSLPDRNAPFMEKTDSAKRLFEYTIVF